MWVKLPQYGVKLAHKGLKMTTCGHVSDRTQGGSGVAGMSLFRLPAEVYNPFWLMLWCYKTTDLGAVALDEKCTHSPSQAQSSTTIRSL